MKSIRSWLKTFQSVQGYFIADHRTLRYIQVNRDLWDRASVAAKFGALGLGRCIPDMKLNEVQERFVLEDVKVGISARDLGLFDTLCNDLLYIDEVKYVVSYLLSAHDPYSFPIWDERRRMICEWEEQGEVDSYDQLKVSIDQCKTANGCSDLDYFMFNKLLWLCE
ncbi:MAG: hypothetical protein RIA62_18370 [Cyclobacteriaceae bacterium]